ncbi:hypothetical protein VA602_04090 [Pseudomonas sp. MH2]|uniref:Type VI secretion system (T6SS), amidase immunity protein n=1 Tax=Pseudomonas machongensis TaxID=3110229 RepID=A0ABU5VAZ0_9PSED|nr:hypothetical protein [Pseudomonas sp. MH2]MEA5670513.1 hypothetical protein [Pseudomonas sp. MH2]
MHSRSSWVIYFSLCFAHPLQAMAEYDKSKLIDAMVPYVAINDVMEKISRRQCSSAVHFENTARGAIQETTARFKSQDQDWVRSYFSSPNGKARLANNDTYIERFLSDAKKEGMDEHTACATLAGMVLTLHHQLKRLG